MLVRGGVQVGVGVGAGGSNYQQHCHIKYALDPQQDLVPSMASGSFGGILFDAYPLSPGEAAGDGEVGRRGVGLYHKGNLESRRESRESVVLERG